MNAFTHMASYLSREEKLARMTVTPEEYEVFCKEFVFNKLREEKFGSAFCRKFDITDMVLELLRSEQSAKDHIKTMGYIRDSN